jgi:hypothetical protein
MVLTLMQSCKKDDDLGLDIINLPGDRFGFSFTDTATVLAWTQLEDSVQTSGVYLNLLGSYSDPVFGRVNASIYTQALLSTNNVSFGTNPVGDSLVLTLRFNGYYGDSMANHRVRIHEIDPAATFVKDSSYYSNQQLPLGDLLFDQVLTFNPVDSTEFNGKKVPALLKIKLNQVLTDKLINASGTADLVNNAAFRNFFKGIHIAVDEVTSPGNGSVGYFNLNADLSALTLFYHNAVDTLTYPFVINEECAKFTSVDHAGYQHAEPGLANQDTNGLHNRLYLQSLAGAKIQIRFPHLATLQADGAVAIAKAELILKADPSDFTATDYPRAPKLTIARINDEGKYSFISDVLEGETFLGGTYNSVTQEYRFRVTRHVQDILNNKYQNHGLVVLVAGASVMANRVVISGNTLAQKNLRLEIVYAKP